ncbi:MAG: hypothetical protein JSS72_07275 [Armatimonadetes bacterium]|nr:hypothetical protein [Armatimonadota bacterium]
MRGSTKGIIVFAVGIGAAYGGWNMYAGYRVANMHFDPIKPGRVNLLGVELKSGFRIIVANQMAQLVQGASTKMGSASAEGESDEGSKKRLKIKEMLQSLQGNEEALGEFVASVNDLKEEDLPVIKIIWKAEDLKKALDGDAALQEKLVKDLNVKLDGTPIPELRTRALENGICIQLSVPVRTNVGAEVKTLHGNVLIPFKPRLMQAVEARYRDKAGADKTMQLGYYQEEAKNVLEGKKEKQDVAKDIRALISPESLTKLSDEPTRILENAKVVINESMVTKATLETDDTNAGKRYTLNIGLTEEGANRLWQYSRNRVGNQLLLIVNGAAIAAPRVEHELTQQQLQITQLEDKWLAESAVNEINKGK